MQPGLVADDLLIVVGGVVVGVSVTGDVLGEGSAGERPLASW